ncbi:MAG: DUF1146 domain-containing protein [Holdemanella sp.]|nr:DUF1146 domain-containing protein [Holdemanella sp.]
MVYSLLRFILFVICFALSLYALTGIQFDKFCNVKTPSKVILLTFLLALIMGYLSCEAILQLTIFNGFGG